MQRHALLALAAGALAAVPALTLTAAAQGASAQSASAQSASAQGAFVTAEGPDRWRASKFVGVDVIGPDGRKVGDVSDVLMDHDGRAAAVVIGVGGFLGLGQKDVALPFASVHFTQEPRPGSSAIGAPDSAAGTPTEPGMAAGSAVPVETPAAQSTPAAAAGTGTATGTAAGTAMGTTVGAPPSAALGGPVGTTAGVAGGQVMGLAGAPAAGPGVTSGATAAPARSTARPDHATVDLTADQLKAAPAFTFAR